MPVSVEPSGRGRFTDVRRVDETGSTNTDLLAAARAGEPEGIVLVAGHQTAGRGRLDRMWQAPPGSSLLVSVLCRPALPPSRAHLVTVAAGLAAADAVEEVAGTRPSLKWPNDVVVETADGTRKLAGLLAESVVEGAKLAAVVVGMGMNVRWAQPLPDELASTATAVNHTAGRDVAVDDVLGAWLGAFDGRYEALLAEGGIRATAEAHRAACSTLGRRIRAELADGTIDGQALDVDEDGHLVLDAGGTRRTVAVGDVIHLRPAPD
ncbi:MAG: biotin--[acetyl-CoA-carboxylase] ligase [Acidimicrobiales bacterium]